MKISEIVPKQATDEVQGTIIEKGETRDVKGGMLQVCDCILKDDSGQITLTLWNKDIGEYNVGDVLKITKGWANEFQGKVSLSSGRFGKIEKVGTADGAAESVPEDVQEAVDNDII